MDEKPSVSFDEDSTNSPCAYTKKGNNPTGTEQALNTYHKRNPCYCRVLRYSIKNAEVNKTTKTIASAVFKLRFGENSQRVGQLIFDPNGEYANENPQDQGCLRNISNIPNGLEDDVVTYGLQPNPKNDPDRKITKFNFFGGTMPSGKNPGKSDLDETLQSLYQGKQIIDEALREESAGYIKSFLNVNIEAPPDADDYSVSTRYRRALFVYKSVLVAAGFDSPGQEVSVKDLFGDGVRKAMEKNEAMKSYAEDLKKNENMSWNKAAAFCRAFSEWSGEKNSTFKDFDNNYKPDRKWSDDRFLGLLRIFEDTRGLSIIQEARQWHELDSDTDYADDIVKHIRAGRLVIFDQALEAIS